ncbi:heavy metal translocating P-type ATPase [Halocatena pleomorpha]|uniref:Cation-translocating P-type ATPase n=1 Tax=Halocatena pleomorpha TaxID=1785090 RepID=A0A3P3RLL7_9EURY|nr:cation-translocating P-type ATPase [Halocatena pleomorpha]RRJ34204.1 cation-translocating P-type ATPase [Halocatena pleomorpha]
MTTVEADGTCDLCGMPLDGSPLEANGNTFCCVGCREVSEVLSDRPDIEERDIRSADTNKEDSSRDEPPPNHERAFLRITGMHCTTCETFLETVAEATDGIASAEASYVSETVRVDYDPERLAGQDLPEILSTAGYTAYRPEDTIAERKSDDEILWRLIPGVLLGMWVMLPYIVYIYPMHFSLYPDRVLEFTSQLLADAAYFYYVLFLFTSIVLFYTGMPILRGAYVSLKVRHPNMDLLVALAACSAYLYSTIAVILGRIDIYYDVTTAIIVVVTAGTYYESSIKRKAVDLLSELSTARVDTARRYQNDGTTTETEIADLTPGDRILVRAGERIPVDGVVCDSEGTVDEAIITGESLPVTKRTSDTVVGGSVLTNGALVITVGEDASSSLDRITALIWNLKSSNRGIQQLADKMAVVFVPVIVSVALAAGGAYVASGATLSNAVLLTLTVLIVSCPCALGLATPLAVASSIREAMEHGLVVFDDTVFERLRGIDTVVFDKTGTLTTGDLTVHSADAPAELLQAVVAVERRSSHPAAAAIAAAFGATDETDPNEAEKQRAAGETANGVADTQRSHSEKCVSDFQTHTTGVEGTVGETNVLAGHPKLFVEQDWEIAETLTEQAATARAVGRLPVIVGRDGTAEGLIILEDEPREEWEETVTALQQRDVEIVILTGDETEATDAFRDHPHVDTVIAGVPPAAKAETVQRLQTDGQVAMVGDGTNDGPALAKADLGIALGSGTALAVDAAEIAIVNDDLSSIETVFDLAVKAKRRVKQNIGWAFLYNAIAIPIALSGALNPLFAATAMATSSLLVVTNSSRQLLDESDSTAD